MLVRCGCKRDEVLLRSFNDPSKYEGVYIAHVKNLEYQNKRLVRIEYLRWWRAWRVLHEHIPTMQNFGGCCSLSQFNGRSGN